MKPTYIFFLLFFSLTTVGCATSNYNVGKDFDSAAVSSIERGKTTAADLVATFGEPFTKTVISEHEEKWIYTHISGTAKAQSYIVTMRVESEGTHKTLDLLLRENVVVNYAYNEVPMSSLFSNR